MLVTFLHSESRLGRFCTFGESQVSNREVSSEKLVYNQCMRCAGCVDVFVPASRQTLAIVTRSLHPLDL